MLHASVVPLLVMCLMIEGLLSGQSVYIRKGGNVTLKCSVNLNDGVWFMNWEISQINATETESITQCYTIEFCECHKGVVRYMNKSVANFTEQSYKEGKSLFNSNLMIQNVGEQLRDAIIECAYGTNENFYSNISIYNASYSLIIYELPKSEECLAVIDNENVVQVMCQFLKVFPKIICQIFLEDKNNTKLTTDISKEMEVKNTEYEIDGYTYYNVSCKTRYLPQVLGVYQFRVEVHLTDNMKISMNITTDKVNVVSIPTRHSALKGDQEQTNALHFFIAAVAILGIIITLILLRVITYRLNRPVFRFKQNRPSGSTDTTNVASSNVTLSNEWNNQYEYISDSGRLDDFSNEQSDTTMKFAVTTGPLVPHIKNFVNGSNNNDDYIDPCTSLETSYGSSEEISTPI